MDLSALLYIIVFQYNPGLLPAFLLDIASWEDSSTQWGWSTVPCVGGVEQRRWPHLTFCVSVKTWRPSYIPHTLSHERHDFRKNKITEHKMRVLIFSTILSETFLIVRRTERDMCTGLHLKCPLFLSDINETWIFSTDFEKNSSIKFHENPSAISRAVPCEQKDRHDEDNSRFSQA